MSIVANHSPEVLDEVNSQEEAPKRVRKPRPKPERRIKVLLPFNDEGQNAVVNITVGKQSDRYYVAKVAADWGKGFTLAKFGSEDQYHVNLNADGNSCDCKGHLRHGHCKHADGLAALVKAGKL